MLSNKAPAKCWAEPLPDDAYANLPSWARAKRSTSASDLASKLGVQTNTLGNCANTASGANAVAELYGSLSNSAGLTAKDDASSSSVVPSGTARATWPAATVPLAPGLFSTTTGWPSASAMRGAISLATTSAPPPAG
jgi:hypothetical protein